MNQMDGCYLIHLSTPLGHCNHYIGWSRHIAARFRFHKTNQGSRLTRACNLRGINYVIVRVWPGADRAFERKLHNRNNAKRLCPLCNDTVKQKLEADAAYQRGFATLMAEIEKGERYNK